MSDRLRRAIVELTLDELAQDLDLDAQLVDVKVDHMRGTIRLLVTRDDLERVPMGFEPPFIDRATITLEGGSRP